MDETQVAGLGPQAMDLPDIVSVAHQIGISPVYYFFKELLQVRENGGRTAGRKIGVVQEIVLRKLLEQSVTINERMLFERMLPGFSGAFHKVEFVFYALLRRLRQGDKVNLAGLSISIERIEADRVILSWNDDGSAKSSRAQLKPRSVVSPKLAQCLQMRSIALNWSADVDYVSVLDVSDVLASVESKRVGAQVFIGSEKLGSGIQTIEKAKQTSLVAIDADLRFNKVIRPILRRDDVDPETRRYISIVALGNGVHWTANDHNILNTYVDHTYLVRDEAMMRYGGFVRDAANAAGQPVHEFFMSYFDGMTKACPDAFSVEDADLAVIEPSSDQRSLKAVLENHLSLHNLMT